MTIAVDLGGKATKQTNKTKLHRRGGTLIFSYICRLGPFFWGQNFEFQYFLGVFRKLIFFLGMKILWIFFWGHHKIGLNLVVISMHFRVFS